MMRATPQHTYQILTKRSLRLRRLAHKLEWPSNVWMGVSVENVDAFRRIEDLRQVPAAVRFLSCEPLLGPLDGINLGSIDWVIAGGRLVKFPPDRSTMGSPYSRYLYCR